MHQPSSMPATGYPAPPYPNGGQPPPHGNAYPYPPYPQQQQPQYYNPNPSFSSRSFFRAFIATMVCLVVVFGVILIITWLVLRPTLPSFQLTSLTVTNFSSTTTPTQSLTATWHLSFISRNRNKKMTVTYNALRSSIFYRDYFLADSQLAPFKQDTKSETALNATLSVAGTYVEPRVLARIDGERRGSGSITFDVQIVASTSFRSGSWRFRTRLLKVLCRKVSVGISTNATSGSLVGGTRECQVWT